MERRPTSIRTTLTLAALALTLIAPWALGQDPDTITEIRLRAEQGDASAQYNLGVRYANGEGVLKDEAEAVRWYRLSADQGDADAQYNLAFRYAKPRGHGIGYERLRAPRHVLQRRGCPQGRCRGRALVSALSRSGERHCAAQPRGQLLQRRGCPQGFRARAHVVQHRWRKRERSCQGGAGQS